MYDIHDYRTFVKKKLSETEQEQWIKVLKFLRRIQMIIMTQKMKNGMRMERLKQRPKKSGKNSTEKKNSEMNGL